MTETLRVLALIDTYQVSGPGRQLAALAAALRPHGVQLSIGCIHRAGRPEAPYLAFLRARALDAHQIPESGPLDPRVPGRVADLANRLGADLLQTHSYKTTVAAAILRASRRCRAPWIAFSHGATTENLRVRMYHHIDHWLLPRADRIVVMSQQDKARFRRASDRVRVIYNAILPQPAAATPRDEPAELRGVPRPRLLFLGRLSPEKGLDLLLEALRLQAGALGQCSLIVAGEGPDRSELEVLAGGLPAHLDIRFVGHLVDGARCLPFIDLLVIPSRSEGLPNALLEAIGADRPVVATAVGAIPEILGDSGGFRLVPPGDPIPLGVALVAALAEGQTPEAQVGRQLLRQQLALERRVAAHLALYEELI